MPSSSPGLHMRMHTHTPPHVDRHACEHAYTHAHHIKNKKNDMKRHD